MEVESGVSQLKKNFRIYTTLLEIIEERGNLILIQVITFPTHAVFLQNKNSKLESWKWKDLSSIWTLMRKRENLWVCTAISQAPKLMSLLSTDSWKCSNLINLKLWLWWHHHPPTLISKCNTDFMNNKVCVYKFSKLMICCSMFWSTIWCQSTSSWTINKKNRFFPTTKWSNLNCPRSWWVTQWPDSWAWGRDKWLKLSERVKLLDSIPLIELLCDLFEFVLWHSIYHIFYHIVYLKQS